MEQVNRPDFDRWGFTNMYLCSKAKKNTYFQTWCLADVWQPGSAPDQGHPLSSPGGGSPCGSHCHCGWDKQNGQSKRAASQARHQATGRCVIGKWSQVWEPSGSGMLTLYEKPISNQFHWNILEKYLLLEILYHRIIHIILWDVRQSTNEQKRGSLSCSICCKIHGSHGGRAEHYASIPPFPRQWFISILTVAIKKEPN